LERVGENKIGLMIGILCAKCNNPFFARIIY